MNLDNYVLAILSTGNGASYSPMQVQKTFFLLDRETPNLIDGRRFNFLPYHYGPFDQSVFTVLDRLVDADLVTRSVSATTALRFYRTTGEGQCVGNSHFAKLDPVAQDYATRVTKFVQSCTFPELVTAIYKQYPDMQTESVFG